MKPEDLEFIRRVADEVKSWPEWKRKDQGFQGPYGDYEIHVPNYKIRILNYDTHTPTAKTHYAGKCCKK